MARIGKLITAVLLGAAVLCVECGQAQTLPQTSMDALQAMTEMAGVIFTGQVVAVRRHDALVEIVFAVGDAVRGVSGGSYTLREWAGLWPGGNEPFRVGQFYLMLLHSPGAGGLSSPVGGMDGAIPIRGGGEAIGRVVDLSWVGTRVMRSTAYLTVAQRGTIARPMLVQTGVVDASGSVDGNVATASGQQSTAYSAVIGMLLSWEARDHGSR